MQANKALMQAIFSELAQGNGRPLVDAMADNFCWTFKSEGPWRASYRGKQAVREELLAPLMAQFADLRNGGFQLKTLTSSMRILSALLRSFGSSKPDWPAASRPVADPRSTTIKGTT